MVCTVNQRVEGGSALSTPAQLGYRMPAEWEPHAGTWLTWPRREGISFPDIYDRIPPIFATMIRALSRGEGVFVNVRDSAMEEEARDILKQHETRGVFARNRTEPCHDSSTQDYSKRKKCPPG